MPHSFTRTLKFKVRSESYSWSDAAAIEVNQVFHYGCSTSVTGNEPPYAALRPSHTYGVREAGPDAARGAA